MTHEQIAKGIASAKREFAASYSGRAHVQEILPTERSESFPIDEKHLDALFRFAESNPMYYNSFEMAVGGVRCTIYEGDINEYWLGSIKHGSSCQPFYPTWLVSAYVLASSAKDFGCTELVDIGSGDGRIAFCAALHGMRARSIEIDGDLVRLQESISRSTGVEFGPTCADALTTDYASMGLTSPAFAVGGLPQMGGEMLAEGLFERLAGGGRGTPESCIVVLAGQGARSGPAARNTHAGETGGWGAVIDRHGLDIAYRISLPSVWTFDQDKDTQYIYAKWRGGRTFADRTAKSPTGGPAGAGF